MAFQVNFPPNKKLRKIILRANVFRANVLEKSKKEDIKRYRYKNVWNKKNLSSGVAGGFLTNITGGVVISAARPSVNQ
jgi:hypothetical protein